jgi:hypothetical protein
MGLTIFLFSTSFFDSNSNPLSLPSLLLLPQLYHHNLKMVGDLGEGLGTIWAKEIIFALPQEDDFRNFLEEFKVWCLSEEADKLLIP